MAEQTWVLVQAAAETLRRKMMNDVPSSFLSSDTDSNTFARKVAPLLVYCRKRILYTCVVSQQNGTVTPGDRV